jgi:hypothetical protein
MSMSQVYLGNHYQNLGVLKAAENVELHPVIAAAVQKDNNKQGARDYLTNLPTDLISLLFQYLPVRSKFLFSRVSKRSYTIFVSRIQNTLSEDVKGLNELYTKKNSIERNIRFLDKKHKVAVTCASIGLISGVIAIALGGLALLNLPCAPCGCGLSVATLGIAAGSTGGGALATFSGAGIIDCCVKEPENVKVYRHLHGDEINNEDDKLIEIKKQIRIKMKDL